MGDRGYGNITIGGDLPRSLCAEFLEVLKDSGINSPDADGGLEYFFEGEFLHSTTEERLMAIVKANSPSHLYGSDGEAAGCMFEGLENWCIKHKLPFQRHSDSLWENSAENLYFSGEKPCLFMSSDNSGNTLVDADIVKQARLALDKGNSHLALRYLDEALKGYDRLPELPAFRIVDG